MIRYLSGVTNEPLEAVCHQGNIGLLVTPDTKQWIKRVDRFPFWSVDNGCFNHPERSVEDFMAWLVTIPKTGLFAPAPDVVGNAQLTLERSLPVLPMIREAGWDAAYVAQDGIEHTEVPWDEFDVLFLGGTTEFKLGPVAREHARRAKEYGKKVHMGRVNSFKRMKIAHEWGCDTVDGTYLAYGPKVNLPKLISWMERLNG